jgi:hypothetical protein
VRLHRWLLLVSCGVVVACSPSTTLVPTLTLIPATATTIPSPVPPTATPESLPEPQDLFASPTSAPSDHTPEALIEIDPIAAELVSIAQRLVAQDLDLPTRRVRFIEAEPYAWTDSSLGCPVPGQTYTSVETNGYRIVVSAGDQEYIFHTDFDRVLPCDPENEQLPIEATPEVSEEATEDSTQEATEET